MAFKKWISGILDNGVKKRMDVEARRKTRLLNVSCALGISCIVPISILSFSLGIVHFLSLMWSQSSSSASVSSIWEKTSRYDRASHIFIHAIMGLLIYAVYKGAVENTGPLWIFVFPMLVFFLYELRRGLIYTCLFSALVLGIMSFPEYLPGAAVYPGNF